MLRDFKKNKYNEDKKIYKQIITYKIIIQCLETIQPHNKGGTRCH